ncbi:hypothetical protein HANVADRAFT_53025 [Hanseniaspora valbyensis NRRL Y-1626]|uniref:Uncharacterized protein n=1 Tax=Hanseniaspora valbyensis NRRL Y-1626 TaxID=766949 RepID=A0A1B7TCW7_9ASCO|nr:hypothetical protein HANVADRAFT_53025 [Hanseniaspora valbyensis NRRL Y-1626]
MSLKEHNSGNNIIEQSVEKEILHVSKEIEELESMKNSLETENKADADFISTLNLMTKLTEYIKKLKKQ